MKKLLFCLLLLVIPFMVYAEECSQNSIILTSIELNNTTGKAEDIETNIENNKINMNVRLKEVGDSIEYEVKVKNQSTEEYYLNDATSQISNEYINYSITYEGNNNIVQPKSNKKLNIKVEYREEIPSFLLTNNKYTENNTITFDIANEKITNPKTLNPLIYIIVVMIGIIILPYFMNIRKKLYVLIILGFIMIPLSVYAICNENLECETNVEIIKDPVVYPSGKTKATVEIGDLVSIGSEEFYVISNDGNNLTMLSRYNLKIGKNTNNGGYRIGEFTSEDDGYGLQCEDCKGYDDSNNRYGLSAFSNSAYWSNYSSTNVYDSNSLLYEPIERYKTSLINLGAPIKEARLLYLNEAVSLGCSTSTYSCSNAQQFLKETSFWLGTCYRTNSDYVYYIIIGNGNSALGSDRYSHENSYGIRPVIVI